MVAELPLATCVRRFMHPKAAMFDRPVVADMRLYRRGCLAFMAQ